MVDNVDKELRRRGVSRKEFDFWSKRRTSSSFGWLFMLAGILWFFKDLNWDVMPNGNYWPLVLIGIGILLSLKR